MSNGESENLGHYATEDEAARAYDSRARELFGDFACLNFPDENPAPFTRPVRKTASAFRGVSWARRHRKWVAHIRHVGRLLCLGFFGDEEAAARAYDAKARELKGDRAILNFPSLSS